MTEEAGGLGRPGGVQAAETGSDARSVSRVTLWAGRASSALPIAMLFFSAGMKFAKPPAVVESFTHLGWPEQLAFGLGILEAGVAIIYLVPQTSVLGAILVTGYLGGATATHVRIGEPWFLTVLLGMLIWLGLYLREPRLRSLIPLKRSR